MTDLTKNEKVVARMIELRDQMQQVQKKADDEIKALKEQYEKGEAYLLTKLNSVDGVLRSEVLVVPHHGSHTSSGAEFLAALAATFRYLWVDIKALSMDTTLEGGVVEAQVGEVLELHTLGAEVSRDPTRPGGYTRILKMGFRVGDNAPMAYMELVERTEEAAVEAAAE